MEFVFACIGRPGWLFYSIRNSHAFRLSDAQASCPGRYFVPRDQLARLMELRFTDRLNLHAQFIELLPKAYWVFSWFTRLPLNCLSIVAKFGWRWSVIVKDFPMLFLVGHVHYSHDNEPRQPASYTFISLCNCHLASFSIHDFHSCWKDGLIWHGGEVVGERQCNGHGSDRSSPIGDRLPLLSWSSRKLFQIHIHIVVSPCLGQVVRVCCSSATTVQK